MFRILCTNLGYARGIDGSLKQHMGGAYRYLYTPRACQLESLSFLQRKIDECRPHLSCFLEIDQGSTSNGFFNQISPLRTADCHVWSVENKYGRVAHLNEYSFSHGKSNGFMAHIPAEYSKHFFDDGTKRLVYEIVLDERLTVFLLHCSLRPWVRKKQFTQLAAWAKEREGHKLLIGDFNIFAGPRELAPLVGDGSFTLVNDPSVPTFRFGNYQACVDLCLASPSIADKVRLEVIDQPCSDHQMLLLDVDV